MVKNTLPDRIIRIRELEHFCKIYTNSYIHILEERGYKETARAPTVQCEHAWQNLLKVMHQILVQEGLVEVIEDETVYEE
jgi:hypothetical protein